MCRLRYLYIFALLMTHAARPPEHWNVAGAALAAALAEWAAAAGAWVVALREVAREAGSAGPRAHPAAWPEALAALAAAEAGLAPAAGAGLAAGPAPDAPALMRACDRIEDAVRQIDNAHAVITSDGVRAVAARGMSRTYSDELRGLVRAATAAEALARAAARDAVTAAAAAGAAAMDAAALPPPGGAASSELFLGALLSAARDGDPAAAARLAAARSEALGVAADTAAAAAADAETLAEYHPLQAMCYSAQPAVPWAGGAPPVDLALPRARLVAEYDLAPLIDRRRATQFGPVASTTTGLSYRLVERLRTIRATRRPPASPGDPPAPRPALCAAGDAATVADGGATRAVAPRPAPWAPYGGAQPRVGAYAEAAAAIIVEAVAAEREAWPLETVARYEQAARDGALPPGAAGRDALLAALAAEFEREYDGAPPTTPADFRALVVGDGPAPGAYVTRAVAGVGREQLEAQLRAELAAVGAPRVPFAALAREARLTQALGALDAAQVLARQLHKAYRGADPAVFEAAAPARKLVLLADFRRSAAAAVDAAPVLCCPPSLKLFAAVRGKGATSYTS